MNDFDREEERRQEEQVRASTSALAVRLSVAPASVTGMIQKLHRDGLVEYAPYRGVVLTAAGQEAALRLLRRHRLWELFLTEVLGLPWDEVHVEAHRLEHATSDRVAERLAAFLRQPAAERELQLGDARADERDHAEHGDRQGVDVVAQRDAQRAELAQGVPIADRGQDGGGRGAFQQSQHLVAGERPRHLDAAQRFVQVDGAAADVAGDLVRGKAVAAIQHAQRPPQRQAGGQRGCHRPANFAWRDQQV